MINELILTTNKSCSVDEINKCLSFICNRTNSNNFSTVTNTPGVITRYHNEISYVINGNNTRNLISILLFTFQYNIYIEINNKEQYKSRSSIDIHGFITYMNLRPQQPRTPLYIKGCETFSHYNVITVLGFVIESIANFNMDKIVLQTNRESINAILKHINS